MNRSLTALFAAFEALLVAAIGIAIPLAPLTVLWAFQYGLAIDWVVFWRAAVDIWLLGHGVDITVILDSATATVLGLPGAEAPVTLTIAALGFALLSLLLGVRAGRRVAETRFRLLGEFVSITTFGAASFAVTLSAIYPLARPSSWQGALLPTLVFATGVVIGSVRERNYQRGQSGGQADAPGSSIRDWINDWSPGSRAVVGLALRGGAASAAFVVLAASVLAAALIVVSYAEIISLYEGLHTEVLGGVSLTLAQLALVPNIVIWGSAWLIGPGFAIGSGSMVSPLATQLGPIPAVPILGALPTGEHAFGFVGLLVPVLAGFLAGAVVAGRVAEFSTTHRLLAGAGVGLVGGAILGALAAASAGAAGPGRLATVGPDALQVAVWATVEIGVAAVLGILAASRLPRRRE